MKAICGMSIVDRVTNDEMHRNNYWLSERVKWHGHMERMEDTRIVKIIYRAGVHGDRKVYRQLREKVNLSSSVVRR